MTRFGRGFAVCAVLLVSLAAGAQAQSVVVVPAGVGRAPDGDVRSAVTSAVEASDLTVVPAATVQERLGLAAPGEAPDALVAELGSAAEATLELVASGESARGIERGEAVLANVQPHLAAIGRDAQASADLANVCLYLVRAELQEQREDAAADRARVCWYLVPDLPVSERLHPPNVRQLVQRVRLEIDAGSTVLAVRAPPGEQAGCQVRLNGRPVGETPEVRRAVVPGRYAVQAECSAAAGPVRVVQLDEGSAERVLVHPGFETALRLGGGGPALVDESADQARERLASDAGQLARAADVPEAIAALAAGRGVHLHRVHAGGTARVIADAQVAAGSENALAAGVQQLLDAAPMSEVEAGDSGRPIVGPLLLGIAGLGALGAVGVGALTAEGCEQERDDGTCVEPRSLNTTAALVYGGIGAAAVVGAILWFALGGSGGDDTEEPVDIAVGPTGVDVRVAF